MWRILNSIPRTFRQHFHGPRASTNLHSEEERCEVAPKCECVEDPPGCREQQQLAVPCLRVRGQQHTPPGGAGPQDGGQERQDWWRTCHGDFWSLFHGQRTPLEAVTWGTAVILGLQLSRWDWWRQKQHQEPGRSWGWHFRLLCQVAFARPGPGSTSRCSILPSRSPTPSLRLQFDEQKEDKAPEQELERRASTDSDGGEDHFSKAVAELQQLSRKATALERTLTGLHLADMGDLKGATSQLETASGLGHHPASFNLALCYQHGQGVERNITRAVELYQLAASGGHAQAQYNLALLLLEGEGLTPDLPQATRLLEQAAAQGLAQAQTYLGVLYTEEKLKNMDKAVSLFRDAAAQNDPEGQFFLGICYEQGWGVEASDEEAAAWYRKAAEQGHPQATYNLAVFTEYGLGGVGVDLSEAWRLYHLASEAGHEAALHHLQESQAKEALSLWADEAARGPGRSEKTESDQASTKRSLSPSLSTPTLSDFVHRHLTELFKGELWFSPQPYLSPRHSSPSSSLPSPSQTPSPDSQEVRFFLGGDDEECEATGSQCVGSLCDPSQHGLGLGKLRLSQGGFQRTSTMPNLQTVACP